MPIDCPNVSGSPVFWLLKRSVILLAIGPCLATAQDNTWMPGSDALHHGPGTEGFLALFVYPPSAPVDYSTPASALRSVLSIELDRLLFSHRKVSFTDDRGRSGNIRVPYTSTIGHTLACISCTLPDGTRYRQWASVSSLTYARTGIRLLFREQAGMRILFHDYPDGILISGAENWLRLIHYNGSRMPGGWWKRQGEVPRYMARPITRTACSQLKEMISFFAAMTENTFLHAGDGTPVHADDRFWFGSSADPWDGYKHRKKTGTGKVVAGCAPFGVALWKAAGGWDHRMDSLWTLRIQVGDHLIGGPGRRVSVPAILWGKGGQGWITGNEPAHTFASHDPALIWSSIEAAMHHAASGRDGNTLTSGSRKISGWWEEFGWQVHPGRPIILETEPGESRKDKKTARSISGIWLIPAN